MIIRCVGDICPGDKTILGSGVAAACIDHHFDFPFEKVKHLLENSDILIGNLEGPLSAKALQAGNEHLPFMGLSQFAAALRTAGFNVINLANNHILEHGPSCFNDTVNALKKVGIQVCGLRSQVEPFYSDPVYIETHGFTIGIIGYNWVGIDKFPDADMYIAQSRDSSVNYTWQRQALSLTHQPPSRPYNKRTINDIHHLKQKVDIVFLYAHWGYEFVHYPPAGVIREAHNFIDAGADIIIGCHPHVLQGMEFYREKPIFYSLGNFVFDSRDHKPRMTAILSLEIKEGVVTKFDYEPLWINSQHQPETADAPMREKIIRLIAASSRLITSPDFDLRLQDDAVYRQYEQQYKHRKFLTILYHFLEVPRNPATLKVILTKMIGFLKIIRARFKGQRIRW
jgi:poly-gamma-glutamate synthesis protein (capsule biosynthesis protein)